ncbi:MAG: aminotransferase class I/II-fold pyridoxal phosphate-dependent enzyme [Planctomycetes bacterium]|nr:aminotransferase class I/II-fold pyridoxal phosphate-dependent enzyme [Planctomycetota bacterium]
MNPDFEQQILRLAQEFLDPSTSAGKPVAQLQPPRAVSKQMGLHDAIHQGVGREGTLRILKDYLDRTTRVRDPRFMAHQVAVPYPESAMGEMLHSLTNNGYGTYEMGPQAAALELELVDWFLQKIGWTQGSGLLTHGGSLANLTALLSARAATFPQAWQDGTPSQAIMLAPEVSHYSVQRSAAMLGLGTKQVWSIPVNDRGMVCPDGLDRLLQTAAAQGKQVMAVVANACATATGLFDPLPEIVALCKQYQVWLHVDGCHGASVLLSDKHRHLVVGIDGADSVSWDAHKLLGSSALCAAVLYREEVSAYRTFDQDESYLSSGAAGEELPFLRSVECTKSGLGMRLFMVLAVHGEQKLAADLERMFQNAQDLYQLMQQNPELEVAMQPQSNIVLFRPNVPNSAIEPIRRQLIDNGNAYLSAADFDGKRWLRACLMNPETGMNQFTSLSMEVLRLAKAVGTV